MKKIKKIIKNRKLFFQKSTFQYFIFWELLLFRLIFCTNTLGLPVVLAKQLAATGRQLADNWQNNWQTTGRQRAATGKKN